MTPAAKQKELDKLPTRVIDGRIYYIIPLPAARGWTNTGKALKKAKRAREERA